MQTKMLVAALYMIHVETSKNVKGEKKVKRSTDIKTVKDETRKAQRKQK